MRVTIVFNDKSKVYINDQGECAVDGIRFSNAFYCALSTCNMTAPPMRLIARYLIANFMAIKGAE